MHYDEEGFLAEESQGIGACLLFDIFRFFV